MPMIADPRTIAGPLTAADLEQTRKHSTGTILPAGLDYQGRYITRPLPEDCAEEGGEHHEPSQTIKPRPWIGVAIVLMGWPLVAAVVGAVLVIAHNLPAIPG